MAIAYVEADKTLTGTVTLIRGDASKEEVSLSANYERNGKAEVEKLPAKITFSGNKSSFKWDTNGMLEKDEMFLPLRLTLWSPKSSIPSGVSLRVVLYHPTLEVLAVDEQNKPVADAVCKVSVRADEDFAKLRKSREDYRKGADGSREFTVKTDAEGKAVFTDLPVGIVRVGWEPPYALAEGAPWKTDGAFSETGPKRKAAIRKLPHVHYIWWGNPTDAAKYKASASDTPNGMAQFHGKTEVVVVRPSGVVSELPRRVLVSYSRQANADTLAGWLHPWIVQRKIDPDNPSEAMKEDGFAIPPLMGRAAQLDAVVKTMSSFYMFSAVKDLISLCVLYRYGGFYFDTTMLIPKDNPDGTPDTLDPVPDDIRLPATATGGTFTFLRHDNSQAATIMGGYGFGLSGAMKVGTANADVWAMYAPPKHPALHMMVESYLDRCVALGLDGRADQVQISIGQDAFQSTLKGKNGKDYPKWIWKTEWDGTTFQDFINNICKSQKAEDESGEEIEVGPGILARNRLIGNLIITSVQEGVTNYVNEYLGKPTPAGDSDYKNAVKPYLWKTKKATPEMEDKYKPARVQAFLEEFNDMPKAHSGSWRKANPTV